MISSISGLLSLNNLDMTSSANDVIVVRHANGRLFSTPFNVRFGKVKVLRPSDKVVRVEINGVTTSAVMKMGPDGEAFWLKPTLLSECVGGRPESPVDYASSSCKGCGANGNANKPFDVCSGSGIKSDKNVDVRSNGFCSGSTSNGNCGELLSSSQQQLPELVAPDTLATPAAEKVAAPLIKEDPDGSLRVNAEAVEMSMADVVEVHLAEETVVAAEAAMRQISRLNIEGDEYLRETAMSAKGGGTFSPDLVGSGNVSETSPDKIKRSSLHSTEYSAGFFNDEYVASGPPSSNVLSTAVDVNAGIVPNSEGSVDVPVFGEKEIENEMTELAKSKKDKEKKEKEEKEGRERDEWRQMEVTAFETTPEKNTATMVKKSSKTSVNSLISSDEFCDKLDDDYLFESVNEVNENDFKCDISSARDLSFNAFGLQDGRDKASLGSSDFYPQCDNGGIEDTVKFVYDTEMTYFVRSLIPTEADLCKLNLVAGHNTIRYITHSSLRGEVTVEANIYLWDSDDRLVVSDIDGTITKSDLWGHLMPLFGRDWTHPGICSLYTKIHQNGYKFVYLTARSVSQVGTTRNFLWNIRQDDCGLPKGPVLTAPQRFFTALTQEVSKKSHVFKIACLKSVMDAFPNNKKPFYAGFGNRFGDMLSYTATQIPRHKIFIIDPNSVLHVYNVKQTYKNLAHLVDVTFPPVVKRNNANIFWGGGSPHICTSRVVLTDNNDFVKTSSFDCLNNGGSLENGPQGVVLFQVDGAKTHNSSTSSCGGGGEEQAQMNCFSACDDDAAAAAMNCFLNNESSRGFQRKKYERVNDSLTDLVTDQEFDNFLYWRVQPADIVTKKKETTTKIANKIEENKQQENGGEKKEEEKPQRRRMERYLKFSLGSYSTNYSGGKSTNNDNSDKKKINVSNNKNNNNNKNEDLDVKEKKNNFKTASGAAETCALNTDEKATLL